MSSVEYLDAQSVELTADLTVVSSVVHSERNLVDCSVAPTAECSGNSLVESTVVRSVVSKVY